MNSNSRIPPQDVRQVLDDLLTALLAASPRNADLPVVKQARDLASRFPGGFSRGALGAFEPQPADDVPASIIRGMD